jgi:hypothetical protein
MMLTTYLPSFFMSTCLRHMGTAAYLLPQPTDMRSTLRLTSRRAFRVLGLLVTWYAMTERCPYWLLHCETLLCLSEFLSGNSVWVQGRWFVSACPCTDSVYSVSSPGKSLSHNVKTLLLLNFYSETILPSFIHLRNQPFVSIWVCNCTG